MTREIKLRAWDGKKLCKVLSVKFLAVNGVFAILEGHGRNHTTLKLDNLMQSTGLKDNTKWEKLTEKEKQDWIKLGETEKTWNGKEIYEGDIVEEKDFGRIFKIEWDENEARFELLLEKGLDGYKGQKRHIIDSFKMEIIGNIWEHPELLK